MNFDTFNTFMTQRKSVSGRDLLTCAVEYILELEKMLFQPIGSSHHDANKCPYCRENLNGKD